MAWFKKFIGEIKDEWKRMNSIEKQDSNEDKSVLDLFELEEEEKERMNQIRHNIANKVALANMGVERYGAPTITFKGKSYNAKTLLRLVEHKDNLTIDEMAMCEMMIFKINEQIDRIAERDEDGYVIKHTGDEVLDMYLTFITTDIYRLERILKQAK